jgi:hypothetical protein
MISLDGSNLSMEPSQTLCLWVHDILTLYSCPDSVACYCRHRESVWRDLTSSSVRQTLGLRQVLHTSRHALHNAQVTMAGTRPGCRPTRRPLRATGRSRSSTRAGPCWARWAASPPSCLPRTASLYALSPASLLSAISRHLLMLQDRTFWSAGACGVGGAV